MPNLLETKKMSKKTFGVRVTTMEADLEFRIEKGALGRDLFDLVCRTIGLREVWYFGLQYMSSTGIYCWLEMNKKVLNQDLNLKNEEIVHFLLLVKFYPEVVEEELIQDVTRHLLFLQVKQAIIGMDVYCQPEASVLLASYAAQASMGDFDPSNAQMVNPIKLDDLLPRRVINQYQMTEAMWEERIAMWWSNNRGYSREDAESEYLKIAQDLDMYGIHYFPIHASLILSVAVGVSAHGLNIYNKDNKLVPKTLLQWNEIRHIAFKDKRFTIKTIDGSSTSFSSKNMAVNQVILDLAVGTHNLFLRRRQPDSLEIQQMRAQAKEERARRLTERARWEREAVARAEAEAERDQLLAEAAVLRDELATQRALMARFEETAVLLAEKAKVSEEEALLLANRLAEAESHIQQIKISAIKTEEAKIATERKARETELIAARILDDSQRRLQETERLKSDLQRVKQQESAARERFLDNDKHLGAMGRAPPNYALSTAGVYGTPPPADPRANATDIGALTLEIEKERVEYAQKSRHLQEQLADLRCEIDGLKVDEQMTEQDRIFTENLMQGDDKYSTLRKSGSQSARKRIQLMDGL